MPIVTIKLNENLDSSTFNTWSFNVGVEASLVSATGLVLVILKSFRVSSKRLLQCWSFTAGSSRLKCHSKGVCLPAPGRAIKHVKESVFTREAGTRRGVPRVLVVLTDGRSQDDVNKVSKEMQMEGEIVVFRVC